MPRASSGRMAQAQDLSPAQLDGKNNYVVTTAVIVYFFSANRYPRCQFTNRYPRLQVAIRGVNLAVGGADLAIGVT